jgi:hypothetical protein
MNRTLSKSFIFGPVYDRELRKVWSRILAIVIATLGLVLTGILIAIAVRAVTIAMQAHASGS